MNLKVVVAALALATIPAAVNAGTDSVSFQAKATVNTKCTITKSGDLDFGVYDPLAAGVKSGSATLNVSCTRNTGASIAITTGGNFNSVLGAGLDVSPVQIHLNREASKALLTLRNGGEETVRYQVSVFAWDEDPSTGMKLSKTEDIVAFPAAFSLKGGESHNVRVGATSAF